MKEYDKNTLCGRSRALKKAFKAFCLEVAKSLYFHQIINKLCSKRLCCPEFTELYRDSEDGVSCIVLKYLNDIRSSWVLENELYFGKTGLPLEIRIDYCPFCGKKLKRKD